MSFEVFVIIMTIMIGFMIFDNLNFYYKSRKIKIYDYANKEVLIEVPRKKIKSIFVHVLSGDETGKIIFMGGSSALFDASKSRTVSFDDGYYVVNGEKIKKWLEYTPNKDYVIFGEDWEQVKEYPVYEYDETV